jgi:hypothetical protein
MYGFGVRTRRLLTIKIDQIVPDSGCVIREYFNGIPLKCKPVKRFKARFESQRDHWLKGKKHEKPANITFAGFFILGPTPKTFNIGDSLASDKGVFLGNRVIHQKCLKLPHVTL